jgi:hypothetical protein
MEVLPSISDVENPRLRKAVFWTGSLLVTAGAAAVYHWNPETARIFPICPVYRLTGCYCPGCGMTRALHQLLHGNIPGALHFNPLLVLSMPVLCYWVIAQLVFILSGRTLPQIRLPEKIWWAVLVLVFAFGVVRNFSFYPFTLLSPR